MRARTSFSFGWIPGLILGLAAVCGVVYLGYLLINKWELSRTVMSERTAARTVSTTSLPADVVLPIIAQCESATGHYDRNGQVIENASGDIGKYQINLPTHAERAEKLGIDLYSEEGNEEYARLLYKENGTRDWNASADCWAKQLVALGYLPQVKEFPLDVGSAPVCIPAGRVQWESDPIGVRYQVFGDGQEPIRFPVPNGQTVRTRFSRNICFQSLEADPVVIKILNKSV